MAKPEKTAPAATDVPAKPNNRKKLLLIILGVLLLGAGGGAAWYFTKGSHHAEEAKAPPPATPKFIALEPFTVNLQHDGSDQFLQLGITLKFVEPELEEKIKLHMPEIRSHLIFLLSSKHASELVSVEGKKKLVKEIIAETGTVLGMRSPAPKIVVYEKNAAPDVGVASAVDAASDVGVASAVEAASVEAASAPDEAAHGDKNSNYVLDVLFTSFIIQ